MSKKITTVAAISKVTKEMGKSGEVAKISITIPGDQASNIPLGGVIITIVPSQKTISFDKPEEGEEE